MAKNRAKHKGKSHFPSATHLGAGVALAVAVAAAWYFSSNHSDSDTPATPRQSPPVTQDSQPSRNDASNSNPNGMGPEMMAGQAKLLNRLLEMLQKLESLKGDDLQAERLATSREIEADLEKIEAEVDVSAANGKQQAGLIALVRAALKDDREGDNATETNWDDEGLLKTHGLVTYATQAYWDEAYSGKRYGESFDWYGAWQEPGMTGQSLGDILRPFLAKDAEILVLGCGNSNMSALMYSEGFHHISNVDVADAVIEQMKTRYGHLREMSWQTMDATALTFANKSFDVVIEKGLFDALFAGTGTRVHGVLSEVRRVLRPTGRLLSVTFSHDRVERLFKESPDSSPMTSPMSCQIASELTYNKTKVNQTKGGQKFYIYSCGDP